MLAADAFPWLLLPLLNPANIAFQPYGVIPAHQNTLRDKVSALLFRTGTTAEFYDSVVEAL